MRDIVGQMLDPRCVKEIFRPQKVLTKKSLRTVFDRLAHASIMKLNSSAMEKVCVCLFVSTCMNSGNLGHLTHINFIYCYSFMT